MWGETTVYTPIWLDQGFVETVGQMEDGMYSEHWQGGYWEHRWSLFASAGDPEGAAWLIHRFNNWLAYHVEHKAKAGGLLWEGLVCELELSYGRVRRRRSLIDSQKPVYNAIRVTHGSGTTSYYTQDESIARYGRIEKTYSLTDLNATEAAQFAQMALKERAWPIPYVVGISEQSVTPRLEVTACGYWVTSRWRDNSYSLGGATALSTAIAGIVAADCPVLSVGRIETNSFSVSNLSGSTAGQRIENLVALGDSSLNQYRAFVGADQKFYYVQADFAPAYRLMDDGVHRRMSGPVLDANEVRPGIFRDESYPVSIAEPGSRFLSSKDMLVSEVQVKQNDLIPDLRTAELDDVDVLTAQIQATREMR